MSPDQVRVTSRRGVGFCCAGGGAENVGEVEAGASRMSEGASFYAWATGGADAAACG